MYAKPRLIDPAKILPVFSLNKILARITIFYATTHPAQTTLGFPDRFLAFLKLLITKIFLISHKHAEDRLKLIMF